MKKLMINTLYLKKVCNHKPKNKNHTYCYLYKIYVLTGIKKNA